MIASRDTYGVTSVAKAQSKTSSSDKLTGALFLLQFLVFLVTVVVLGSAINWPASLDEPASVVLPLISEQRGPVLLGYSAYMLSALLLIPLAFLTRQVLGGRDHLLLTIAAFVGAASGVLKILGLTRWLFVMPFLSDTYVSPTTSEANRATLEIVYNAFTKYGGGIGENLGVMLFSGGWTVLIAIGILRSRRLPAWAGWFGLVAAAVTLFGFIEVYGINTGPLLTVSGVIWQLWAVTMAALLFFTSSKEAKETPTQY